MAVWQRDCISANQKEVALTYIMFVIILIVGKFDHTVGALQYNNKEIHFQKWAYVDIIQ